MGNAGEGSETDADPGPSIAVERLRQCLRWLRNLHRGFAYTGHLPRRRD